MSCSHDVKVMSPLEALKSWLTEMAGNGHPKSFYSTLLRGVVEKISELEAAEEKPRPDSAGTWWRVGWTNPQYLSENAIKSLSVQPPSRWIKAHKPTFSAKAPVSREAESESVEAEVSEPTAQEIREWCEEQVSMCGEGDQQFRNGFTWVIGFIDDYGKDKT